MQSPVEKSIRVRSDFTQSRALAGALLHPFSLSSADKDQERMRCYYWPRDTRLLNQPLPQAEALAAASVIDVPFASRAPADLRRVLPREAFAFQIVQMTPVAGLQKVLSSVGGVFGRAARYNASPVSPLYLVGKTDLSMDGRMMLRPETGNFVMPEPDAFILRPEDLRPVGSPAIDAPTGASRLGLTR